MGAHDLFNIRLAPWRYIDIEKVMNVIFKLASLVLSVIIV